MKISTMLSLAITARQVTADFHILAVFHPVPVLERYTACPSDYYNCDCFSKGDRAGKISGSDLGTSFSIEAGLCGMPQLDLYIQEDGSYYIYEDGGNGDVLGTCVSNSGSQDCGSGIVKTVANEVLVCYSYICNAS
jgi:hypothetical protein